MSNSLINIGVTGLNAGRSKLNVISNNISHTHTAGYNRQQILFKQVGGTVTGSGVDASAVDRVFDSFVVNQLRQATSESGAAGAYYSKLAKIDKLFADNEGSIPNQLENVFSSLKKLSSKAGDIASRQSVLSNFESLINQFNKTDRYLREQIISVNTDLVNSVNKINDYTKQIAELNEKIAKPAGSTGLEQPNNLLDQRDQLVNALNAVIGVTVTEQNQQYHISMANGLSLVQGSAVTALSVESSVADVSLNAVVYTHPSGEQQELNLNFITSGSLNGLLTFRDGPLVDTRNQLALLALHVANRFNNVHGGGVDLDGQRGEPLCHYDLPSSAIAANHNKGHAALKLEYVNIESIKASDYKLEYEGTHWTVSHLSDRSKITIEMKEDKLVFDGLSVEITGSAVKGDAFIIKPVAGVAGSLKSLLFDPSKLAAGIGDDKNGISDNRNIENLLKIQDEKLIEGKSTLHDAYVSLVGFVGSETHSAKVSAVTSENIVHQISDENQSISGVNIDEEYISMQVYMQYYQANAQIIQTAKTLFDTILGIVK